MFYNSCLNKVSKITQACNLPKVSKKKKKFFVHSIKMSNSLKNLGLPSEELKAIAEIRGLKVIRVCIKVSYYVPYSIKTSKKR